MAVLSKIEITTGQTIEPGHVTQSIDAFSGIEKYDIFLSGSFNMTGSINGEPGIVNPLTASFSVTASQAISSSFATSASFATTASFASNAAPTATLTFFHTEVTDTENERESYIGGFGTLPNAAASRIGLHAPFNGTITHCVASSHASTPDTAQIGCSFSVDGGSSYISNLGQLDLSLFTDASITTPNIPVTAGDEINIRLVENANSNAVWNVNVILIIKEN
jgi:hypothetical protein